jgi:hypothetical protein
LVTNNSRFLILPQHCVPGNLYANPPEDLVLDLGPDKTIYAVGDEFHQYYTRILQVSTLTGTQVAPSR